MAKRVVTVMRDPETGVLDRDAVVRKLVDFEAAGDALGGVIQAIPIREPVGDPQRPADEYVTVGWMFVWDSTAPARQRSQPEQVEESGGSS